MADHLKIHPVVDVEAPSTVPLVPSTSSKSSQQGESMHVKSMNIPAPPPRAQLPPGPPPTQFRQTTPLIPSPPPRKSRSFCCKCICWTISLLILILVILGAIVGILYLVFQPKIPKYSVDRLQISDLRLNTDGSLYAKFDVQITAKNPNKKIGIYYQDGSHLSVWYAKTKLCQGKFPKFYQGHRNETSLNVSLTGQAQYGNTLLGALQEQQQTGRIPLDLKVDVPVSVKLGKLKLRKVRILGNCLLIVDTLSSNSFITIKASSCKFRLKL
ncbi:Late embryogenesis abundant hydroxyproline-rich glycoprotein family [Heracleum sosnowskyi]|uniref:Late embryogenesis abundant hydroxyproline-rich glycoprotein family n=1 Tax=Heracleum sosnowskyi TaxID=360622 RepID=A0AAD8MSX8_9APIA|nr:Late embryogenesis abundant hydroxyproline-rich glycoprotein family [Heracleum sosnowskyi]